MILLAKNLGRFCRRFERDIWGVCYTDKRAVDNYKILKKSWLIRFFLRIFKTKMFWKWKKLRRYIYRIDIIDIKQRKKKYNKRWLSIRLTRLYFLTLQDHQFRKLFTKARKLTGDLQSNYCHLLEGRLLPLFYRTNFLSNLFKVISFIKDSNVFLNFKTANYVNFLVKISTLITFDKKYIKKIRYQLNQRIKAKAVLFNTPRFLFISFRFWFCFFLKKPLKKNLVYPISIDIQRITGYY